MNYFITEEQEEIRKLAEQIREEKILPVREKYDREGIFPRDIIDACSQAGLSGVYIPEEYGGFGGGVMELVIVTEELSVGCLGTSTSYAATALGTFPIIIAGNEEQKKKYLPGIAAGEFIAAFALTEADAGSDPGGIKTTAVKKDGKYILNGTKQWITNGGEADVYTIIAQTDKTRGLRGLSAFIVEKDTPGFTYGKKEDKLGIRASATRELVFEDCAIPEENLLGVPGTGIITTLKTLDRARAGVAAQAVGLAEGAMREAIKYSRERHQFDKPISAFQAVQHILADMAIQVEAARALTYSVARHIDGGAKKFSKEAAIAKTFATDMAMKVTIDAIQVLGGYGYMREYPVEKMMRDAKILQIYEGTNQIQRNEIAASLIKEAAKA
ncbi:MAG: acyl-CoA dehydrogenase family protein [Acidobacteria bacterium]|nr:acyl-CoA dehydrogenase family protein [Acidobacteriota bacterium]